jgi:peptidoglycan hydrolase-like protein with peptidoglycan-binding domain
MVSTLSIQRLIALTVAAALLGACTGQSQTVNPISAAPAASSSPTTALNPPTPPLAKPTEHLIVPAATPTAVTSSVALPTTQPVIAPAFSRRLLLQNPRLQGEDVKAVQERLRQLGYAQVGKVDGIYGPNTNAAVRAFQTLNGLPADAILGPRTWERLFSTDATAASTLTPVVASDTGWLLGGVHAGKWLDGPTTAALLQGGEAYRLYTRAGLAGTAAGSTPRSLPVEPCANTFQVTLALGPTSSGALALGGDWNPQPRPPVEEATTERAYQETIAKLLRAHGIRQPEVRLTGVVRVDLDGDGTVEVLIAATRYKEGTDVPGPDAGAGDYSLLVLYRQVNGTDETIPIAAEYYPEAQQFVAPQQYDLVATLDLNGDGRMEVVVNSAYYEGAATTAYTVIGKQVEPVLEAGCGV